MPKILTVLLLACCERASPRELADRNTSHLTHFEHLAEDDVCARMCPLPKHSPSTAVELAVSALQVLFLQRSPAHRSWAAHGRILGAHTRGIVWQRKTPLKSRYGQTRFKNNWI
jgi:hypothetical protein